MTAPGDGPRTGSGSTSARRPVHPAWREGTWTRAKEIESLCAWIRQRTDRDGSDVLLASIGVHLRAAEEAALPPPRRRMRDQALLERAMSNLDAAEALLLDVAPPEYVLGRLPGVLNDAVRHLGPTDVRRLHLEHIARRAGIGNTTTPLSDDTSTPSVEDALRLVEQERLTIATAYRAASSAALREQLRVRSFRNVLLVTTALLTVLAVALAVAGFVARTAIPVCFEPQVDGRTVVVCPTAQSQLLPTGIEGGPASPDIDDAVRDTAQRADILIIELIGLAAAAVAAAAAIRGIRGSSEPHNLPVALALLKLPTGALTAVLGLLLMRGQFIPGLTALDSSAQILAWALVFGYGQQLFTRLVDQQAHTVLNRVRSGGLGDHPTPQGEARTSSPR
ncbi:hypothetical protein [Geodermatophilus sp. SYSU D01176]